MAKQMRVGDVTGESTHVQQTEDIIKMTFNRGKSERVKKMEQQVKINRIKNNPFTYTISEAFFEDRQIFTSREASAYVNSTASYVRSASEYDKWSIYCPSPVKEFANEENIITIDDSIFYETCCTCNGGGQVPCTVCRNGKEVCPNCNGYGGWNCGSCGGRGVVQCSWCYGSGKTCNNEIVGYDKSGVPIRGNVYHTCGNCGGSGNVRCGNCGGGGYITCRTCGGGGDITCRTCHGTQWVTCYSCSGCGGFVNSVRIRQTYGMDGLYTILNGYDVDTNVYGDKKFADFQYDLTADLFLEDFVDVAPIQTIPAERVLSEFTDRPLDVTSDMLQLEQMRQQSGDSKRFLKYKVSVYQRAVCDVEYEFDEKRYNMMYDGTTKQILMDANPYQAVSMNQMNELEQYCKEMKLKSFLDTYDEFASITQFDNVSFSIENVKKFMQRLEGISVGVGVLGSVLVQLLFHIPAIREKLVAYGFWRYVSIVLSLAAAFGFSRLWKKLAKDDGRITYGIIAGASAVATIIIYLLLGKIF